MSKRLEMLEAMAQKGNTDPFVWYGLAMEYKNAQRNGDAIQTFERLRAQSPDYLPMYLMAGQLLSEASRESEAAEWLRQGKTLAEAQGNHKTLSEIELALVALGED